MFFLGVQKPKDWTSHDLVNLLRILTGIRRIGHTGTLDPFATGVLILAFQDATKLIAHVPPAKKRYQCVLQLGLLTETADRTGAIVRTDSVPLEYQHLILQSLPDFIGNVEQTPPKYSAIKVNGRRLYEYARAGQDVEIPSRVVHIESLKLMTDFDGKHLHSNQVALDICCSKGTYIRSLGCDLSENIGTVGYLEELTRSSSDGVDLQDCITMDDLAEIAIGSRDHDWQRVLSKEGRQEFPRCSREMFMERLIPHTISVERMFASMPKIQLTEEESLWLARGRCVDSVRRQVQDLKISIAQGLWQERQLGLVTGEGTILRVNPSIASMRIAQSIQSK